MKEIVITVLILVIVFFILAVIATITILLSAEYNDEIPVSRKAGTETSHSKSTIKK